MKLLQFHIPGAGTKVGVMRGDRVDIKIRSIGVLSNPVKKL